MTEQEWWASDDPGRRLRLDYYAERAAQRLPLCDPAPPWLCGEQAEVVAVLTEDLEEEEP